MDWQENAASFDDILERQVATYLTIGWRSYKIILESLSIAKPARHGDIWSGNANISVFFDRIRNQFLKK